MYLFLGELQQIWNTIDRIKMEEIRDESNELRRKT